MHPADRQLDPAPVAAWLPDNELRFHILRGKDAILRMHAVLVELSGRCEQVGAMDHIALFLDSTLNENKVPLLIVATERTGSDPFQLRVEDLRGAAVVYEYLILGRPSGVFVTDDGSGSRTVIAAPEARSTITISVCQELMRRGARVAALSYKEEVHPETQYGEIARLVERNGILWGSQVREMSTYLTIQPTFDETLAQLGRHTRRNLRYYRRRTEVETGCQFLGEVRQQMSKQDFFALNRVSTHPVEPRALARRYDDLARFPDSFCVGIRAADGRWLSLMGGRRHHGLTEVDWQLNRAGMDRLSLGTAMRSYFLEHEVTLGTERLYFEGGTPHTMRHSLLTERAVDVLAMRRRWDVELIRALARSNLIKKNFLLQTLADPAIRWQAI